MLVRFGRPAWRSTSAVLLWLHAAACSLVVGELPEPLPDDGGPSAGAGPSGGGAANPGQAGEPASQAGDGAAPVGGSGTAGTQGEGGGAPAELCDVDHDEHLAKGKCGGDDCDDSDDRVSPAQGDYFGERQSNVDFDYDCSGMPEQEPIPVVTCSGLVGACPTDTGFLKSLPACGEVGSYGTCEKSQLGTCVEKVIDAERTMRCH